MIPAFKEDFRPGRVYYYVNKRKRIYLFTANPADIDTERDYVVNPETDSPLKSIAERISLAPNIIRPTEKTASDFVELLRFLPVIPYTRDLCSYTLSGTISFRVVIIEDDKHWLEAEASQYDLGGSHIESMKPITARMLVKFKDIIEEHFKTKIDERRDYFLKKRLKYLNY